MSEARASFGTMLRQLRSAATLSQEELAERAGLSRRGISDLERGLRQAPRLETVRLLADALLLGDADRTALLAAARPALWERAPSAPGPSAAALPVPLTPLIGRETELAALRHRLAGDHGRLVTITGPGGVGKTRVALAVAEQVGGMFPDGVWFVDLSPLDDPSLVAPAVGGVLGVREGEVTAPRLSTELGDKRLLLVLDNFERVVEAAPFVADILALSPGCQVLVTSRIPLHAYGEQEYPLAPLPLPDPANLPPIERVSQFESVRLFVARAQAVKPDFAVTTANAPAVAEICFRLDGLPLAIELAAARVKVLPPQALLQRLEQRLPLLTGGARTAPARQQTMREAIAWSHDLLSPAEQTLFRRLAVFPGGCTLEAAEAVAGGGEPLAVFAGLVSLVDQSLLRQVEGVASEPRFRMLETVREFALERLVASGDEALARRTHAAWFFALAEAAEPSTSGGDDQTRWLDRLEADHPNLRAALEWFVLTGDAEAGARLAASLADYWLQRSHRSEGRVWLEQALAQGRISDRTRAKALRALGRMDFLTGGQKAVDMLAQSLTLSRGLADTRGAAAALLDLGIEALIRGDLARATPFLVEAGTLAEDAGDLETIAMARLHLGLIALEQAGPEDAEPVLEEALALFRRRDDAYGVASTLLALGWTAADRQDGATAAARYAQSLALWQELGTKEGVVDTLAAVAALAGTARQPERATRLLAAAAALGETIGYVHTFPERARSDRTQVALGAALGEVAFSAAWATGFATPPAQAAAEAAAVLAEHIAEDLVTAPTNPPSEGGLTPREREVLRLVVGGLSNPEIAAALFLSRRTVTTHLTRIFAKLGVAGRAEAVVLAVRRSLV